MELRSTERRGEAGIQLLLFVSVAVSETLSRSTTINQQTILPINLLARSNVFAAASTRRGVFPNEPDSTVWNSPNRSCLGLPQIIAGEIFR